MISSRWLILLLCFILAGCSLPRIIILNDPLDAQQHNDLGASYEQRDEYDLAIREYRRAAELDDAWVLPLINLGNVYARQNDWSLAIAAYEDALAIDPVSTSAMNNLAWVLVKNDEIGKGLEMAERVVALDKRNPSYWDTLATAYLSNGNMAAADKAARQGLSLNPGPELQRALEEKRLGQP
ncbi:MAG: tetratricopeptide repeat protein [Desulfuromonadales bacterium]|nr:tetratricopeptide repeat protein [Desulfuromonadales bacterium]